MKVYIHGTRKSVTKRGDIVEVTSVTRVKKFIEKCKVDGCKNDRANGSSRCKIHTGANKAMIDSVPKELYVHKEESSS